MTFCDMTAGIIASFLTHGDGCVEGQSGIEVEIVFRYPHFINKLGVICVAYLKYIAMLLTSKLPSRS